MKYQWIILLSILSVGYLGSNNILMWNQYLGNPGRTAYVECDGPDSPEILWEVTLKGQIQNPYVYNDQIVVLTTESPSSGMNSENKNEDNVIIIDLLTGNLLAKIMPKEGLKSVYPMGDKTVLGATLGKLWEIDISTEEVTFISKIPTKTSCIFDSSPIILPNSIIFPFIPVTSISKQDYSIQWDLLSSLESDFPEGGEVRTIAATFDKVFLLIQEETNMKVWAVDSSNGRFIWKSHDIPLCNQLAGNDSFVIAGGNELIGLDTETGEILWTLKEKVLSNIVITDNEAYFTDNKYLYAIDILSGEQKWKSPWDGLSFWITYVLGTSNTIICSDVRNLTCFSRENGNQLWNMHFQDFVDGTIRKSCPAIAKGIIITTGKISNNRLLAITSDPHLFAQQGDAFLSQKLPDKAVESFRKASELYERSGNQEKAQEMHEKITQLELSSESIVPSKTQSLIFPISCILGIVIVSTFLYVFVIQKRSKN